VFFFDIKNLSFDLNTSELFVIFFEQQYNNLYLKIPKAKQILDKIINRENNYIIDLNELIYYNLIEYFNTFNIDIRKKIRKKSDIDSLRSLKGVNQNFLETFEKIYEYI